MATLDDLPADQRAVLSLVLSRGRSYDEIATMLSIDRASVRDRALGALDALGPETDTPALQRAVLTDYLLGQLPPAVADQTRAQLAASSAYRAWARAVAAELAPIATTVLPEIPEPVGDVPEPVGDVPEPVPDVPEPPREIAGPAQERAEQRQRSGRSSRRGGAVLLAILGIVAIAVVILIVGLGNGGTSSTTPIAGTVPTTSSQTATTTTTPKLRFVTQVNLLPPDPTLAHRTAGVAQVLSDGSETGIVIVAAGMPANTRHNAYAVWLADAAGNSDLLGFVSKLVTSNGKLEADTRLPSNAARYSELLITLETRLHPKSPGAIVLEGAFKLTG